jgi:hypothetical protein
MSDAPAKWLNPLAPGASHYMASLLNHQAATPSTAAPHISVTQANLPTPPLPPAELLRNAMRRRIGLVQVSLPGRAHPVWLRAGTDDSAATLKSLEPLPALPYAPRKILEIGAGAGYRSIALASQFSDAEILALEPNPALQRVLLLNTLPYGNISTAAVAVSTDNARYSYTGRAGNAGRVVLHRDEAGPIAAVQLVSFIASRNFASYDTVFIKPDAASDHLLRTNWPASVRCIFVDTGGEKLHQATAICYPEKKYACRQIGDFFVIARREAPQDAIPLPPRPVMQLDFPPRPLSLENVDFGADSYFAIGANGFRLHANGDGAPPARLTVQIATTGYRQLEVTFRAAHAESLPLRFRATVADATTTLGTAEEDLEAGETKRISVALAPTAGPFTVTFESAMAYENVPNYCAWAEFLDPILS